MHYAPSAWQDIIIADAPAFLAGFGIAAAGEFGHALQQRGAKT